MSAIAKDRSGEGGEIRCVATKARKLRSLERPSKASIEDCKGKDRRKCVPETLVKG